MSRIITGRRPVVEALRAGTPLARIYFRKGVHGAAIEEIRSLAARREVPIGDLDPSEFAELGAEGVAQGVLARAAAPPSLSLEDLIAIPAARNEPGFLLVLDEIEDPHNLGALIRTAECAGVHGVVVPRHRSAPLSGAAVKTSAGATEHLPVVTVTNLVRALEDMKAAGYWVVGLDASAGRLYSTVDARQPVVLVVGSEGHGLRRLVREHCDYLVRIPLKGKISSLNASVAGALVLFEVARNRAGDAPRTS
jgi:23S rRNA (guanosine2251-2'-O)-methyltransferase